MNAVDSKNADGPVRAQVYEKRFGFLVSDIARLYGTQFDRRTRGKIELSRAQCRLALYLSSFGEMNQAKLADMLEVTPMTVARMLDRMQEGGWIVRVQDPNDRRAFHIQTTAKTAHVLTDALELSDEITDAALAGFTAAEKDVLIGLLQKIRRNLGSAEG